MTGKRVVFCEGCNKPMPKNRVNKHKCTSTFEADEFARIQVQRQSQSASRKKYNLKRTRAGIIAVNSARFTKDYTGINDGLDT